MKPEKQLYQWDINQSLVELTPSAQYVDYPIGNEVIRIKADGTRCRIPDEVLQTYGGKTCYERYPDGTYRAYSFTVLYAPKPPDYVYTPEERTTFEALTARVDASIEEIKRRADSGEFTPKKGVDYFTDAEKTEMMESVSSGAVGEFRKVVDTATTEYNANAAEKLTTYDTNDEQRTSDYNRNAEMKLEAYNSNHTEKLTEYNTNAENKTAEFDANAAALQTEVDRLRGECDNLAAENRKQENRIDALMKLNKGQTYDILPEQGETASRTAPSGAKYVSVDKVGGKSIVWNQLISTSIPYVNNGKLSVNENIFTLTPIENTVDMWEIGFRLTAYTRKSNHKYYMSVDVKSDAWATSGKAGFVTYDGLWLLAVLNGLDTSKTDWQTLKGVINSSSDATGSGLFLFRKYYEETKAPVSIRNFVCYDLTQMFGAGNEPATVEEFEAMFPADYYPYCEPTIISSQTDRVDVRGKNIWDEQWENGNINGYDGVNEDSSDRIRTTNYIEVEPNTKYYMTFTVTSWIYEYDIDKNYIGRKTVSNVVSWVYTTQSNTRYIRFITNQDGATYKNNIAIIKGTSGSYSPYSLEQITTGFPVLNSAGSAYDYIDLNEGKLYTWTYIEGNEVKALTEPVITDITIPTELSDWLTVETGGSVTFHNSDESKQLPVPNAVSWVRKLDEVN